MSRAYVFTEYGAPQGEQLIERSAPDPGPGQLAVAVRAAAVNPVDWKIREGHLGRDLPLPVAMGREVAGMVTAVGPGVETFAVGVEVFGAVAPGEGGFADHTVLDVANTMAKPEDISFAAAATIPIAGTTAYDVTHQIELEEGESLLILGAGGGVGHLAAQIGRVHQFRVIGVASQAKQTFVESTGATFVEAGDGAAAAVQEIAPDGVDLVDGQALRALAPVAKSPERIISAADRDTVSQLGGAGLERKAESLAKITDVIGYEVITPEISQTFR